MNNFDLVNVKQLHMYKCVYSSNNKGPIRWDIATIIICSAGGQEFMAIVNTARPRATPLDSVCFTAMNPGTVL